MRGQAYKFILGLIMIIILAYVNIPFSYVMGTHVESFNSMTTNTEVISYNNIYASTFYIAISVIIIVIIVTILKPSTPQEQQYYE